MKRKPAKRSKSRSKLQPRQQRGMLRSESPPPGVEVKVLPWGMPPH